MPHVETHKLPQLIKKQVALGVTKFKAATIAEAEMCAGTCIPRSWSCAVAAPSSAGQCSRAPAGSAFKPRLRL